MSAKITKANANATINVLFSSPIQKISSKITDLKAILDIWIL